MPLSNDVEDKAVRELYEQLRQQINERKKNEAYEEQKKLEAQKRSEEFDRQREEASRRSVVQPIQGFKATVSGSSSSMGMPTQDEIDRRRAKRMNKPATGPAKSHKRRIVAPKSKETFDKQATFATEEARLLCLPYYHSTITTESVHLSM